MNIFYKFLILILIVSNTVFAYSKEESVIVFTQEHGFYYEPFVLGVSTQVEEAKIYYTLDGSNPFTAEDPFVENSPFNIMIDPENTLDRDIAPGFVLRACVVNNDTLVGKIETQTYLFPDKIIFLSPDNTIPGSGWLEYGSGHDISYGLDPEIYNNSSYSNQMSEAFSSIPSISLVTNLGSLFDPDSGIYVNALFHGREWERAASVELLNPNGIEGFQINCGVRIRGGWSRHYDNPKHAFRFIFRSEYGNGKLKYPLFGKEGADEFDNIDLRTSQNYSWSFYGDTKNTFLREVFSRDTQRDMNQPYTRSRYYHLYINGTYWGLFQTQERSEASFAESYFGGSSDDYDVIKVDVGDNFDIYHVEATDGSLAKWKELWDAGEIGFSDDENYYKAQGLNKDGTKNIAYEKLLDIDNLIDYMIVTFFVGDFDGPISNWRNNESPNNFYAIYNRVNPDGFKFFRHDGEHTLLDHQWGIDRTGPFNAGRNFLDSNPQWIHQKLTENKNYRLRFADRVYKHFYNAGALTLGKVVERISKRKSEIETAIIAESARWGDSKREAPRTKADWSNEVNWLLNNFLPSRGVVVLQQLLTANLYENNSIPLFNKHGGIVEKGFDVTISSTVGDIYYTADGTDPFISHGSESGDYFREVITASTNKKVIIPTNDIGTNWYKNLNYIDSGWLTVSGEPGGIGYDDNGNYSTYLSLNTKQYMHESGVSPNSSCYIRIPFSISENELAEINQMNLNVRFDDGFAIYLNGTKILEENAPSNPSWNSTSLTYLNSESEKKFDISEFINNLNVGQNLLAIHGLNTSLQSSDFLILPKLTIQSVTNTGEISPSAIKYTASIDIYETTTIKSRVLNGTDWSLLSEAKFIINEDLSNLKITELHYHPLDEIVGSDTISGKEFEFIELKNVGDTELTITGVKFSNGIDFEFPQNSKIESDGIIVLASNLIQFENRYNEPADFEFTGNLNNGGERVTIENSASDTLFSFKYNDKAPWPIEADGDGYSLVSVKRTPTGNPDNADYWTISNSINGSPGIDDIVSDLGASNNQIPEITYLHQNYPNPFNPTTTIKYSISKQIFVSIIVYDLLGRKVKTLVNEKKLPGTYNVIFNASDISSGIYFYTIKANKYIETRKLILLK